MFIMWLRKYRLIGLGSKQIFLYLVTPQLWVQEKAHTNCHHEERRDEVISLVQLMQGDCFSASGEVDP